MDYSSYNNILGQRESSNQYGAVNSLGYMGKYQMGAPALQDMGYMNAKPRGVNQKNWINDPRAWTGKGGVTGVDGFLGNAQLQDQVQNQWNTTLDKRTQHFGLNKYIGKTVGGINITADGMRAASHLMGHGALIAAMNSGDLLAAKDGNGTTIADYMKMYSGKRETVLPPQQQAKPVPAQTVIPEKATQMFTQPEPEQRQVAQTDTPRSLNMFQEYFNKFKPF